MEEPDVKQIVAQAISEYMSQDTARREPALKAELDEERKQRGILEKRLNEMAEENKKARATAAEAERATAIRTQLQKLGVAKIDLAYKVVQAEITRNDDGTMMAGAKTLSEVLEEFVKENPELLPARAAGGDREQRQAPQPRKEVDIDTIGPASSREDLERVREKIVEVSSKLT